MSEINKTTHEPFPSKEQIENGWAWCDCGWRGYPEMQEGAWVCPNCYPKFHSEGCLGDMMVHFYSDIYDMSDYERKGFFGCEHPDE